MGGLQIGSNSPVPGAQGLRGGPKPEPLREVAVINFAFFVTQAKGLGHVNNRAPNILLKNCKLFLKPGDATKQKNTSRGEVSL